MGRQGYIVLSLLGVVMWSWLGYLNISSAVGSGAPILSPLLAPSTLAPIALVPISLMQLWKLLSAERAENILNPQFVLTASQSLIARGASTLICVLFFVAGVWSLLGHSSISDSFDSPTLSVVFVALGIYGAVFALFSPRIRVSLSPDGFEYSQMRPASVPWHDITDVKLRTFFTTSWIVLTLKNGTEFRSANLLARWRRVAKVTVSPLMFGIDPEVLKQGIDLRRNVFTF